MLQIAIWGIALMLVVKGLYVLHQQKIAEQKEHKVSPLLATSTFLVAVVGAIILVVTANHQASSTLAAIPALTSYDARNAAERDLDSLSPEHRAQVEAMGNGE